MHLIIFVYLIFHNFTFNADISYFSNSENLHSITYRTHAISWDMKHKQSAIITRNSDLVKLISKLNIQNYL